MEKSDAQFHLEQLAEVLGQRGWTVSLVGGGLRVALRVANPEAAKLAENVLCRMHDGEGIYCWAWGQTIGAATDVAAVADRIQHVLRTVDR